MAKKENYILVTGGAGYIGSHAVKALLNKGNNVVVIDNLSTGHVKAVDPRAKLVIGDISNLGLLIKLFKRFNIVGVMHFAGRIIVPESVSNPLAYFDANINNVSCILRAMKMFNVQNIVFSSTAAVYGSSKKEMITENDALNPTSPYGFSKLAAENLIRFASHAYGLKYFIFRYFNVAGSYETSEIGEAHPKETHLIPTTIINCVNGTQMQIFGNDYETPDNTCVRDYVHVMDLVNAHVLGMEALLAGHESEIINLGSGKGYSNKEVVETVSKVVKKPIDYVYGPRREGDPAKIVASIEKAKKVLNWEPVNNLEAMIESDYTWRKTHPALYEDATDFKVSPKDAEKVIKLKGTKKITKLLEPVEIEDRNHFAAVKKQNKSFLGSKVISK